LVSGLGSGVLASEMGSCAQSPLPTPTPSASRAAAVAVASSDASSSSVANANASASAGADSRGNAAAVGAANGNPAPAAYELAGSGVTPIIPLGAVTIFLLAGLTLLLHRRHTQCEAEPVRVDTLK